MESQINVMDERGQLVPLNLCSPALFLNDMKSIDGGFLPPPPQLSMQALQTPQRGRGSFNTPVSDLEMPLFSQPTGSYCVPPRVGSMLLPDYRPPQKAVDDEPKPNFSYIGLIAKAILSSKERRMVLSEIYEWIQVNYAYFRSRGPGWRNSIRHNLSLNDCFIKVGRSSNGKGHYWGIHPANVEDFQRGDFRRRRAQRKVRRALGLSCPGDGEDSDSPPLSPIPQPSMFPFHPVDSNGRGLLPSPYQQQQPPPIDVFAALLSSLTSAGLLPPPRLPPSPPILQEQNSKQQEAEIPSPHGGGSFSVASLLRD